MPSFVKHASGDKIEFSFLNMDIHWFMSTRYHFMETKHTSVLNEGLIFKQRWVGKDFTYLLTITFRIARVGSLRVQVFAALSCVFHLGI